jgi:pimeloyl-ACP methyl ester carboxylesterase
MTSDYAALLDHLQIGKVTLVGWSDGGIIGIDMAMKHPEKLTRVIAQAANVTTDGVKADVMNNKTFNDYITSLATITGSCRRRRTNTTPSSPRFPRCGRPSRPGRQRILERSRCRSRSPSATMMRR